MLELTKAAVLGVAVSTVFLTSACGSSGSDSNAKAADNTAAYCTALKAAKADIVGYATNPDLTRFHEVAVEMAGVAAKAPASVASTWASITTPLTALDKALTAAGTNLTDYVAAVSQGHAPAGVSNDQADAINKALQPVTNLPVTMTAANKVIAADAKKTCSLDLTPAN